MAAAKVEYSYNTTTTAASDTTSFGYGPMGSLIPNITAAGTSYSKRVRFQTPIQSSDKLVLEYSGDLGTTWVDMAQEYPAFSLLSNGYGAKAVAVNSTDVDVTFNKGGTTSTGATYGSNGQLWSVLYGANYRYRVRKSSPHAPAGIQLATSTTPGLRFADQSCAAYSSASQTGLVSGTPTKIAFGTEEYDDNGIYDAVTNYRITPPAGKYLITASARVDAASANTTTSAALVIYKNGSAWKRLQQISSETGVIDAFPWGGCTVVEGNGSDYFEIYANVTVSTSTWNILSGQDYTYFTCTRIA